MREASQPVRHTALMKCLVVKQAAGQPTNRAAAWQPAARSAGRASSTSSAPTFAGVLVPGVVKDKLGADEVGAHLAHVAGAVAGNVVLVHLQAGRQEAKWAVAAAAGCVEQRMLVGSLRHARLRLVSGWLVRAVVVPGAASSTEPMKIRPVQCCLWTSLRRISPCPTPLLTDST